MTDILYVEDNEDNIFMLTRRLARHGYAVRVARSGEDAIKQAQIEIPDLILMDLILPNMDGWETTRRLRALPELSRTPIIALSSSAMPEEKQRALEAGCNDFEAKPINMKALLPKVKAALKDSKP